MAVNRISLPFFFLTQLSSLIYVCVCVLNICKAKRTLLKDVRGFNNIYRYIVYNNIILYMIDLINIHLFEFHMPMYTATQ